MRTTWYERVLLFAFLTVVLVGAQAVLSVLLPQAWHSLREYRDALYWGGGAAALVTLLATRRDE